MRADKTGLWPPINFHDHMHVQQPGISAAPPPSVRQSVMMSADAKPGGTDNGLTDIKTYVTNMVTFGAG